MEPAKSLLSELDQIPHLEPPDYFHGIRAGELCRADNLIFFLRRDRAVLHETGFTTRPHHRYVLILNFETAGTLNVDGVAYRLHPGEAFLIAPYQMHFYMDVADPSIRWLFLTFEAEARAPFAPFLNLPIPLGGEEQKTVLRLAREFGRSEMSGARAREALVLGVSLLLTRLKQIGHRRAPPVVALSPDDALVERINRLLEWHLAEGLDIPALAARLAMSESHLRKRFRERTHLSLGNYLLHYRLNRAIKLLVHSQSSLTQVAFDCGYESLAAFSRSFKSKVGDTPSHFRKTGKTPANRGL